MNTQVRSVVVLGLGLCIVLQLAGCSSGSKTKLTDNSAHVASSPRSVVVAPVAYGFTSDVAVNRFLATITQPLAERGYYVMPVRMSAKLAAQEGFRPYWRGETWQNERKTYFGGAVTTVGDAYLLMESEDAANLKAIATDLAAYFGADSVLFVQVDCWGSKANYSEGLFANMFDEKMDHCMDLDYLLTDAQGDELWRAHKSVDFTRGGGSWVAELWNASVKASDDEITTALARDVNRVVIEGKSSKTKADWRWDTVRFYPGPYYPAK